METSRYKVHTHPLKEFFDINGLFYLKINNFSLDTALRFLEIKWTVLYLFSFFNSKNNRFIII